MSSIMEDLYTWRVVRRMTQQEAANRLGVSLATYSRWERGICEPTDDNYCWIMDEIHAAGMAVAADWYPAEHKRSEVKAERSEP